MNKPKKAGIVFLMTGAVLIISALLLFLYNDAEDARAGEASQEALVDIQRVIEEKMENNATETTIAREEGTEPEETESIPTELPVVMVQGYDYMGYLTISKLELVLPVMSDWDYDRLQIAPCRQFGSPATDDLVIAAHNYKQHFGLLNTLSQGDIVTFTDMNGISYQYSLASVRTLAPTAVEEVQNSPHALVLYTCTYGGQTRIAAFFDRVYG